MTNQVTPTASTTLRARRRDFWAYLVGGSVLAAIWALRWVNRGLPEYLGAWTANVLFPLLFAYLVRDLRKDWHGFARWFFWLALLLPPLLQAVNRARPS